MHVLQTRRKDSQRYGWLIKTVVVDYSVSYLDDSEDLSRAEDLLIDQFYQTVNVKKNPKGRYSQSVPLSN